MDDATNGFFDDLPDVDRRSCRLLGPTALITQGLMGLLVISSLVYKRHRETPKRPWRIWLFDVSKQVIGQLFVHGVNVLISDVVAHVSSGNACVLYFLNILIDTTLGVGVIYFILRFMAYFFTEKCHLKGFESGQYGSPPSINYWVRQAAVYVFALTTMKLLVVALFAAWPGIFKVGEWLLTFLGPSDAVQVIFTMGLFPIFMNVLQFWLIDSIVKASSQESELSSDTPRNSMDPDNEPLFGAGSDDEDDDDGHTRHDIENPRPNPRSLSRDVDSQSSPKDESKSLTSGSTTIIGSGSNTPMPKAIDTPSQPIEVHAYPPSLVSTSTSTSPMSSVASSSSDRRRSPPPPLSLHPRLPSIPALISAASSDGGGAHDETDSWAAWGDDASDDWADRVGEEDWTGRRMETKKDAVKDVWAGQITPGQGVHVAILQGGAIS